MAQMQAADLQAFSEPARQATLAALLAGGAEMQRDDDLVRKLMLEMEASPDWLHIVPFTFNMSEERRRTYYHMRLLADAGFLEETGARGGTFRMTNQGHDFVAAIRDDTVWNRTKATAANAAGVSLGMLRDIALAIVRQELATRLGLPL